MKKSCYYWEYKDYNQSNKVVFSGHFPNILEADKAFEKEIGKHPSKMSNIGCSFKASDPTWSGARVW